MHGFADPVGETARDAITLWLDNGLALLKTHGLFSFIFGVGLAFLMCSKARRGLPFRCVYRNRMIGLLILGIAHGCLFFPGDILTIYAVTGSILYLFRSIGFAFVMPSFLVIQGSSAPGWFCLGLAVVKSGMIDDPRHPLWRRARRWCLGPGVVLGLVAAAIWQWGPPVPGVVLTIVSAPVATLGYLGLIAAFSRPPGPIMAKVVTAGDSSLSMYLGQSIILSTIFSGYGLGLWGAVDRLTAVAIALAVTAGLIGALLIWRAYFTLGPFEWVLRRITYARLRD